MQYTCPAAALRIVRSLGTFRCWKNSTDAGKGYSILLHFIWVTYVRLTFFSAIYPFDQIPSSGFSLKYLQCRTQNKLFCSTEPQSIIETVAYLLPLQPYFEEIRIMMFLRSFGRKCSRKYPAFGNIQWWAHFIKGHVGGIFWAWGYLQWIRR